MTNYYTIEKHLDAVCKIDEDYKILQSIWLLNKQNISKGLSVIPSSFPGYSSHDASHSLCILNNIENFLGETRIKELGATDAFLILMSALTHDIGMILSYKLIEEEWNKNEFISHLDWFLENGDKQLSEAASILKQIGDKTKREDSKNNLSWALKVKNAVILITSEIFRGKHAKISSDYLSHDNNFWKLANNFYSDQIPSRFMDILSKVAYLHGESFDTISNMLRYKANGYKGDYIHPRFIACLIRLGDLLDFDNNRFNEFSIKTLEELPVTSQLHKQKHASVKHMLVSPDAIEAELDCSSEEVYRVARHWFDMLESEVDSQSREWTNIAPKNLSGLPPIISRDSIKIYFNGQEANSNMLNVKFTISPKKMFNILQGGAIYQEPGFAFIREIVQNALDASKLQLWRDILDGVYDLQLDARSAEEIKYPDDIPQSVYSQYPIHLDIKWTDETRDSITVICTDRGVGISEATLLRMTNFVGESHKKDEGYLTTLKTTPFWLKPTAAFGVGLQSVFFVNKKFIVNTKANGSKAMKIIFRSAADDNYCSVLNSDKTKRGTSVEVVIQKEQFRELFGGNFGLHVLDRVDVFSEKGDEKYLFKIAEYISCKLSSVESFIFIPKIEGCPDFSLQDDAVEEKDESKYIEYDNFKIRYYYEGEIIIFNIIEREYGSIMHLWFFKDIDPHSSYVNRLKLRGVNISSAKLNYYLTSYMGLTWDLHNESSDRIVDLSRDKLLPRGADWVANTLLRNLLPKFIPVVVDLFNNKILKEKEEISDSEKYQHFFATITAKMFGCLSGDNTDTSSEVELQSNLVTDNSAKQVTSESFIDSKCIFLVNIYSKYLKAKDNNIEEVKKEIMDDVNIDEGAVVIWETPNNIEFFHSYIRFTYKCVEILNHNENFRVRKLQIIDESNSKYVKLNDNKYYLSKLSDSCSFFSGSRSTMYPLEEYKHIVVWNHHISGFEYFPSFVNSSIYLPFNKRNTFKSLYNEIKDSSKDDVDKYLRENISKYVSHTMIKRILENSVISKETTEDLVLETYIKLIKDIVTAYKIFNPELQE